MKYDIPCFVGKWKKRSFRSVSFHSGGGQSEMSRGRRSKRISLMRRMNASVHGCALNQSLPVPAFTTDMSK